MARANVNYTVDELDEITVSVVRSVYLKVTPRAMLILNACRLDVMLIN